MPKKLTTKEFIEKHCKKYENLLLDRIDYVNYVTPVEIGCKICGHYRFVTPDAIINNKIGCPKCGNKKVAEKRKQATFEKFKKIFEEWENKEKFELVKVGKTIKIKCKECSRIYSIYKVLKKEFKCYCQKYNTRTFIEEYNRRYPDHCFDFSNSKYTKAVDKIIIHCNKCGKDFTTTPNWILFSGKCSSCTKSGYSNAAIQILDEIAEKCGIFIQHQENKCEKRIKIELEGKTHYIRVDGYNSKYNLIFEYYGSRFHGDPRIFKEDDTCFPFSKKVTAGELYKRTVDREEAIRCQGYTVIPIWEHDYINNPKETLTAKIMEVKEIINENQSY